MGSLIPKPSEPKPPPVPTADPSTVQAQFEAGSSDDTKDSITKKKKGKGTLKVQRPKSVGVATAGSTGSGLSVG